MKKKDKLSLSLSFSFSPSILPSADSTVVTAASTLDKLFVMLINDKSKSINNIDYLFHLFTCYLISMWIGGSRYLWEMVFFSPSSSVPVQPDRPTNILMSFTLWSISGILWWGHVHPSFLPNEVMIEASGFRHTHALCFYSPRALDERWIDRVVFDWCTVVLPHVLQLSHLIMFPKHH